MKPFLFLRPIIPGLTEYEYRELIDLALEYGVEGVVAGSLRVTRRIIDYLRDAGLDVGEVLRRIKIPIEKMKPGIQYDVYTSDIKSEIARYTRSKGLIFYRFSVDGGSLSFIFIDSSSPPSASQRLLSPRPLYGSCSILVA